MPLTRRDLVGGLSLGAGLGVGSPPARAATAADAADDSAISPTRPLRFPRDFGSHPGSRTEWWYITGWLADVANGTGPTKRPAPQTTARATANPAEPLFGFQVTFFRSRTGFAADHPSRFAASQLIFAHAAVSDLRDPARPRLRHDQRIARAGFGLAEAAVDDTRLRLRDWTMQRDTGTAADAHSLYRVSTASDAAAFALDLELTSTQPVLLQGDAGFSRKGPLVAQASHYYSQPQLSVTGRVRIDNQRLAVAGVAWMDHEWSDTLLAEDAVGWDWIGMNLFDGRALTAFRLRRADGSTLWAGGSLRAAVTSAASPVASSGAASSGALSRQSPGGPSSLPAPAAQGRSFDPADVRFTPGRIWRSPLSKAPYPVEWTVDTPVGRFIVRARFDNQELDSRGSTGSIYWEGLSDLVTSDGRVVGRGYLEMTGYASRLQL